MSHSGRGGRDRGRRPEPSREVAVSKALSYILRHAAEREGVKIDSHGYANVADVLAWRKLKSLEATFPEILDAVATSDKQRFGLLYKPSSTSSSQTTTPQPEQDDLPSPSPNPAATAQALAANDPNPSHYLIRATQGHSIKTIEAASLLTKLSLTDNTLPDTVVHGTYHAAWPLILDYGGLKCMSRNHVHFATGPPLESVLPEGRAGGNKVVSAVKGLGLGLGLGKKGEGVISGMRGDAQILIYVDLRRAMEAGVPFWRSENGVVLSEGVEREGEGGKVVGVEFFDVVVERKNGLGVLWDREKGGLVQETPEWMLKAKNPKGGAGGGGGGGAKGARGKGKAGAPRVRVEGELEVVGDDDV
ncbi:hypothetical protein AJ79_01199 [Helicocarpus griseus UAMH5409]|uniref:2'-phosphotransferase n=1 Tax=Helicocarpus griseus UAMH5409 TaxID=1447875 RepID=A0A2B7Y7V5_9EURO|nr:hypothetical protein AJ79_01199 [Helicocarpus griseus UAMH5409]